MLFGRVRDHCYEYLVPGGPSMEPESQSEKAREAALAIIAGRTRCRSRSLNLSDMGLSQIPSEISELNWLEEVQVNHNRIEDLSPLSALPNLKSVDCANTPVRDLAPLSRLSCLRKLECSNTRVSSLGPVASLEELRTLYFWNTDVNDLDPLSGLMLLEDVDCSATFVLGLSALANKPRLWRLNLSRNEMDSLFELGELPRLELLFCNKTVVKDLPPTRVFPRLIELELSESSITRLDTLAQYPTIERLDCAETLVHDLAPLMSLSKLRELNCSGCRLIALPEGVWNRPGFRLFARKASIPGLPSRILSTDRFENCTKRVRRWFNNRPALPKTRSLETAQSRDRESVPAAVPMKAFISYAHRDKEALNRFQTHLALLVRDGLLTTWTDHEILAGDHLGNEINEHLETCDLFIALVSPDYLASRYCYDKEFMRAQALASSGRLRIVPIIIRLCDWQASPFALMSALPKDGTAISTWRNKDAAYANVVNGLRLLLSFSPR